MADINLPVGTTKKLAISFVDKDGNPTTVGIPSDVPVWTVPDPALATFDPATDDLTAVGAFGATGPISVVIGTLTGTANIVIGAGPAASVVIAAEPVPASTV